MIKYLQKVKNLTSSFTIVNYQQVPRAENVQADLLSKLTILGTTDLKRSSYFEVLKKSSIEKAPIMQADSKPSWIDPVLCYLQDGTLLADRDEAKKLRHLAPQYLVYDGKLYKRSFTLSLLRCLHPSKADYTL